MISMENPPALPSVLLSHSQSAFTRLHSIWEHLNSFSSPVKSQTRSDCISKCGLSNSFTSSSSASSSSSSLHSAAVGFSDGEYYDKARPGYAVSVVDFLLSSSLSARIQQSQLEFHGSAGNKNSSSNLSSPAIHRRPYSRLCTTCLRRSCKGNALANTKSAKSISGSSGSVSSSRVTSMPLIRILELGAGTGKFSRAFYSRLQAFGGVPVRASMATPKNSNISEKTYVAPADWQQKLQQLEQADVAPRFFFELIVSEPMEGMRKKLSSSFANANVTVADWSAHKLPQKLPPTPATCRCQCAGHQCLKLARSEVSEFDLIVAAQAIHWFSDEKSLAAIYRNMHNQSFLAVIFNARQVTSSSSSSSGSWGEELESLTDSYYDPDVPRHKTGRWLSDIRKSGLFSSAVIQQSFPAAVVQRGDERMVVQRMLSSSVLAKMSVVEKKQVEKKIVETLRKGAPHAKEFSIEYASDVYLFQPTSSHTPLPSAAV